MVRQTTGLIGSLNLGTFFLVRVQLHYLRPYKLSQDFVGERYTRDISKLTVFTSRMRNRGGVAPGNRRIL